MSEQNNGGPAFATGDPAHGGFAGMSLRDYFAGQALAGMMADPEVIVPAKDIAKFAYTLADAMLEARAHD